jgi:hypothetical protein
VDFPPVECKEVSYHRSSEAEVTGAVLPSTGLRETVMAAYKRFPPVKRAMQLAEGLIRKTPSAAEFHIYSRSVTFPTGKAEGVDLSVAWLRHHGYVPQATAVQAETIVSEG